MPLPTRPLGATGLSVTEAGFGSYRIDAEVDSHRTALTAALRQGINLIDTSSNYTNGRSEILIGRVLQSLIADGELTREQVVLVSKVGYLQGSNHALSQQLKEEGRPYPDLVVLSDDLEHCIHPEFISDQLTRTLTRLQVDYLDAYLLHNPEYYLAWAQATGIDLADARAEYERRLDLAFRHLEQEVANGRIRHYGVSSNTFPRPAADPEFTNLSQLWQIANAIAAEQGAPHHFGVIQLPMNLHETGAATEANQPNGRSVLDFAADVGLGVLINRPLNALDGQTLTRLADVLPPSYPASEEEVSTAVDTLLELELAFQQEQLPAIPFENDTKRQLLEMLAIGRILDGHWQGFGSYQNWRQVQAQYLLPRTQMALDFLSNWENSPPALRKWQDQYAEAVNELFAVLGAFYREMSHAQAKALKATAVAVNPQWDAPTLSQTAVRALRTTRGVSSVLVGMRQTEYVADVVDGLDAPAPPSDQREAWQALGD